MSLGMWKAESACGCMDASPDRFHTLFPGGMERMMEHSRFYLRVILAVIKREFQGVELTLRSL